jgi:hypothetical protein
LKPYHTLEARIKARNRVNKRANELQPELVEIFRPYVGKKVTTQHGLVHKLKPVIDKLRDRERGGEFSNGKGFDLWRRYGGSYAIDYEIKCSEPIRGSEREGGGCTVTYAEATVRVGLLEGDTLKSLSEEPPNYKSDYTEEEIREKRALADKLREEARRAETDLCPFGWFDQ